MGHEDIEFPIALRHVRLRGGRIDAVPIGEAIRGQLYAAHGIGSFWYMMAAAGLVAAAGMYVYGRWTYRLKE